MTKEEHILAAKRLFVEGITRAGMGIIAISFGENSTQVIVSEAVDHLIAAMKKENDND